MYIPKKMVQNEFKELVCPCPRDLYERVGGRIPHANGSSDGSSISDTELVFFDNNKMRILSRMSADDYSHYADEMRKAVEKPIDSSVNPVVDDNV